MEQSDLLKYACRTLERLEVRYLVTGSQATIAYGEPRFTNDIDIVADLQRQNVVEFCAAFPDADYYLSRIAVDEAVADRGMFNVIHPASGLKIDVILPKQTPHDELRLRRGVRVAVDAEFKAVFTSPEDIILKKMQWHEMGGGERHLRDIAGVIKTQKTKLDRRYIEEQAIELGVVGLWHAVLATVEPRHDK
jgi:hypothetical protein